MADEDQHTSDRSARPLPECLTRLLIDSRDRIKPEPASGPKPSLFDRVAWWLTVAMFGAASLIFGFALKITELLP